MQTLERPREPALWALLAASPLPMLVSAAEGDLRLLAINQRFAQLFGYPSETLVVGDAWWALAYPEAEYRSRLALAWRAAIREAAAVGQEPVAPIEARVRCSDGTAPDGSEHWFHTVKVPLVRADGRVQCLGIATDITARKKAGRRQAAARGAGVEGSRPAPTGGSC